MTEADIVELAGRQNESRIHGMQRWNDCARSGAEDMKYTFDPETFSISSEDGEVRVEVFSGDREGVWSFTLTRGDKVFGFQTDVSTSEFYPSRDETGLLVWRIANICAQISTTDYKNRTERLYTNATEFESIEEQAQTLRDFADALSVYDTTTKEDPHGTVKARVEYSEAIRRAIEAGEYLA